MIDVAWLRALGPDQLEHLLRQRPDCTTAPEPESLSELAERLCAPWSVVAAMRQLDRPTLQVAEALAALGGSAARSDLARLLGDPQARHLDRALSTLNSHALLLLEPQPTLVDAAASAWPHPLGLGPPVETTLYHQTVQQLKATAAELRIATGSKRAEILREVTAALRDPELIRNQVKKAPKAIRDELARSAATGEPVEITSFSYYYSSSYKDPGPIRADRWGLQRGMLTRSADGDGLVLVAEVALALRGPDYHAPFEPDPPPLSTTSADQRRVDSSGLAAASAFGNILTAVLDDAGRKPISLLKAGGIGTREFKRLAKATGTTDLEVRLALSVGYQLGLWEAGEAGGAPTSHYDDWLATSPAQRLAELMRAAFRLPQIPFGENGTWNPIDIAQITELRQRILRGVPAGAAIVDPKALAAALAWKYPFGVGDSAVAEHFIAAAWREAEATGMVAAGAVTSAGKALLAGGGDLEDILAAVGSAETKARLGADLTAVVTGTPSAQLARFLDSVADRESRGTASTWRFGPTSVRRALDAGHSATDLLEQLTQVAAVNVPQPLEYLVHDISRQHGSVRARAVASCLRSDDPALLARLVAERKLALLGLRLLAPTVLASAKPLDETMSALRSAGYAPTAEDDDGAMIVQQQKVERAEALPKHPNATARPPVAADDLAKKLLAAPDVAERLAYGMLSTIETYARRLRQVDMQILAHAVDAGLPVIITYVNQQGNESTRVIDDMEITGASLYAWCHLRDDARFFNLGRILSVQPA